MKEEEKVFKKIIKSVDIEINPPEEVKKKIFYELQCELNTRESSYSIYENYLIQRILKFSIPITILITICTRINAV